MNIETEREVTKKITINLDSDDVKALEEVTIQEFDSSLGFYGTSLSFSTPTKESGELLWRILSELVGENR